MTSFLDVALDAAVTAKINDGASATRGALNATFVRTLGPSNGTGDSGWINAAIAAGGKFRGLAGQTYLVNAPLTVHSNTTIDFSGCTVQDTASLTENMLRNWATSNPTATASDAGTTAGSPVVTTGVAATVGQTVIVLGAGASASPMVGEVVSVASGSITLNRAAVITGSSRAVAVHTRDKNIHVYGGDWRSTEAEDGGLTKDHITLFRHVDNLDIDPDSMTSTRGMYGISLGSVTNYRAGIGVMQLHKDGIHVCGPARDGKVTRISGYSVDDNVSITACDYLYIADVSGDVIGFDFGVIDANTYRSNMKIMPGAGNLVDQVTGVRISGTTEQAGVFIGEDTYNAGTTGGRIGAVDLGLVATAPSDPNWRPVYLSNPNADLIRVTLRRSAAQGEAIGTGYFNTGSPSTSVIKRLEIIADITGPAGLWWGGSPYVTVESMLVSGKFNQVSGSGSFIFEEYGSIVDLEITAATTMTGGRIAKTYGAGTIKRITHRGVCTGQSSIIQSVSGPDMTVTLAGRVIGGSRVLDAHCPTTLILAGATLEALSDEPVYLGGAPLTILGYANIVTPGVPTLVERGSNEAVRINGASLPTDLATLTPVDGDIAYNTNAGLSCGAGPAVYKSGGTGAGWKGLYSGATY